MQRMVLRGLLSNPPEPLSDLLSSDDAARTRPRRPWSSFYDETARRARRRATRWSRRRTPRCQPLRRRRGHQPSVPAANVLTEGTLLRAATYVAIGGLVGWFASCH